MKDNTTLILQAMVTCKRQSNHLLDKETLTLLQENRRIIHALANYTPKNESELEWVNDELIKYRLIQKRLNQVWDKDLIQKFGKNQAPMTAVKRKYSETQIRKISIQYNISRNQAKQIFPILKRNDELIKGLQNFNPYHDSEADFARSLYKEYEEVQRQLGGIQNIPKLSLNTKEETIRKINRKRIIVLKSEVCQICGFPIEKALDIHHVKPVSWYKRGEDPHIIENESVVCPNCHRFAHHSLCLKRVPNDMKIYLEGIEGAVERLAGLVRAGLEA